MTDKDWSRLVQNGRAAIEDPEYDSRPVVKLCLEDGSIPVLLAEADLHGGVAFGLVQVAMRPMLRFVRLAELATTELGQALRSEAYRSDLTLTEAALCAQREGRIRDYGAEPCPSCSGPHHGRRQDGFKKIKLQQRSGGENRRSHLISSDGKMHI
jgi:hypothetical protein